MADPPLIAEGLYSYQIGGSERVGVELAIEFARRGYRVVCFAFYDSEGPMRALAEAAGIRCLDFNYLNRRWGIRRATYQFAMWRMCDERASMRARASCDGADPEWRAGPARAASRVSS